MFSSPSSSPSTTRTVQVINDTLSVTFSPLLNSDVDIILEPHPGVTFPQQQIHKQCSNNQQKKPQRVTEEQKFQAMIAKMKINLETYESDANVDNWEIDFPTRSYYGNKTFEELKEIHGRLVKIEDAAEKTKLLSRLTPPVLPHRHMRMWLKWPLNFNFDLLTSTLIVNMPSDDVQQSIAAYHSRCGKSLYCYCFLHICLACMPLVAWLVAELKLLDCAS